MEISRCAKCQRNVIAGEGGQAERLIDYRVGDNSGVRRYVIYAF